jgi:hypothetical protein
MKWFKRRQPTMLAYNIMWFNNSTWLERLWTYNRMSHYYWHGGHSE